jgi:hypothetical protein
VTAASNKEIIKKCFFMTVRGYLRSSEKSIGINIIYFRRNPYPPPDPNDWFHVKVLVQDGQISVFVNGKSTPELVVRELVQLTGKKIGYWAGNGSGGDWKDLTLTEQ